ncbi:MAG: hypothetical protein R2705_17175 [Ilumatobacteraceae bacterium]
MIRLENVTKAYSTEVLAVRDASFDIPKGSSSSSSAPRARASRRCCA